MNASNQAMQRTADRPYASFESMRRSILTRAAADLESRQMMMQRWKNRDARVSKIARYLFIACAGCLIVAFAMVYFEPPQTVETVTDFLQPERGLVLVSSLTPLEKIATLLTFGGLITFVSGFVLLLRSIYHSRTNATAII